MTDWADDSIDLGSPSAVAEDVLPAPKVIEKGDQIIKIFYKWRENEATNKKELIKVTRTFVQERVKTSKRVAARKTWKKFGLAANDGPGPQEATTMYGEEVMMRFIAADQTEEEAEEEDEQMNKFKRQFEYFNFFQGFGGGPSTRPSAPGTQMDIPSVSIKDATGGKYVPPRRGLTGGFSDEVPAIRVSNLSPAATQDDVQTLFAKFGKIARIHLGRDRRTNESRGFAFINFHHRDDAQRAIDTMNRYGYDNLILSVEWSENRKKENATEATKPDFLKRQR